MELCTASLGAFLGHLTLRGRAGMPYMGMPIPNPIFGAARAVELFSRWQEEWREANSHSLFMEKGKELNVVLWNVSSGTPGAFVQLGVPSQTRIDWVVWCYPGLTEEEFYRRFNRYWREAGEKDELLGLFLMEIERDYHHVRSWQTDGGSEAVQYAARAYREVTGKSPVKGGAPFSCDMALYGEHMPVIILGPRGDNLHAPDEWVEVEDLYSLTAVFARLAASWCG
jgi:acetylornithine deacetylase